MDLDIILFYFISWIDITPHLHCLILLWSEDHNHNQETNTMLPNSVSIRYSISSGIGLSRERGKIGSRVHMKEKKAISPSEKKTS